MFFPALSVLKASIPGVCSPGSPRACRTALFSGGSRFLPGLLVGLLLLANNAPAAKEMESIRGCTLNWTDWADGDSFQVKTPAGKSFTVRLYGVDCIELAVPKPNDRRRLLEQRRHFGIVAATAEEANGIAMKHAREAADFTRQRLAKPFTVHTAFVAVWANAEHERFYAFVTDAEGRDHGSELVGQGLARVHGSLRQHPDGRSGKEYGAHLTDKEDEAKGGKRGAWASTDWDKLAEERRKQRSEDEEQEVAGRGKASLDSPLDLNRATLEELTGLPDIGNVRARAILDGRPYRRIDDLRKVPGIGARTLEKIRPYLQEPGAPGATP